MKISVIVTIKNEGDTIADLLESLIAQTRPADEIVVCDGGSSDNTLETLQVYRQWLPLQVITAPGANISQGRNRAIEASTGDIIAVTDAGVVLDPSWLEELTSPILSGETAVVSGWFEADPFTDFEVVMGATVLPSRREIEPEKFLPSSRSVAFLKDAWRSVGGYPEWLDYGEDLVFDMALRHRYGPFPFAGRAVAYKAARLAAALSRRRQLYAPTSGTVVGCYLGLAAAGAPARLWPDPGYSAGGGHCQDARLPGRTSLAHSPRRPHLRLNLTPVTAT
jgi:glycosyltransferase involved in cell wall biosynthesis